VDVGVVAIAFALFGLVALALVWSGDWAYASLAQATGNTRTTFVRAATGRDPAGEIPMPIDALLDWHRRWAAYVVGWSSEPPNAGPGGPLFTPDEYAHMADVRAVFRGAEAVALVSLAVVAFRVMRARARDDALGMIRDASLLSAALVVGIGLAATFAFDALFLLFHEMFFPQGNFLFDPATSNLLRLYPEWYWQGVTAGVGISFIVVAILVASGAQVALRRYTRRA